MHTSAKARLTSVAIRIRIFIRIRIATLVRRALAEVCTVLRFNHLFIGPLPTFPENFMQIRSKDLRKVANTQTDKQRRRRILFRGDIMMKNWQA